jgi:aryl-alcohol dehydrogenase-like predicted oxidoreductase
MPFAPGQSGNPSGRPKTDATIQAIAREHCPGSIEKLVELRDNPKTPPAVVVSAIREIIDRGYGKAVQFSTSDAEEFKRAMELTDHELATIAGRSNVIKLAKSG